jgi:phosphoribosylformylglycinamidine synthase PurS subunit
LSNFQLEIRVKPRPGLLNPEGKAIHHALNALGWDEVSDVRVGKAIYVEMEAPSAVDAMETGEAMCRKILANPVTEDFEVASVVEMEEARR